MADHFDEAVRQIDVLAASIDEPLPAAVLLEVGHAAQTIILLRTKAGRDAAGNQFTPYTAAYQQVRRQHSLRTSPPDLTRTGLMLGSILPRITGKNEVSLVFGSEAEGIKAAANHARRPWFDIRAPGELKVLGDIAAEAVAAQLDKR